MASLNPYDTSYAYNRMKERNKEVLVRGFGGRRYTQEDDSEEYIQFTLERSIIPYWKEHNDIVPEAEDYLCTMSKGTFASLAFKIGATKSLTVGESADLMNAIIALRDGIPRPDPIDLDIPKFPVVQEELRGRNHIRIPRNTNE